MVKMLHKDVDKSCFTLRMIFYRNLCSTLDSLVTFLSQNVIPEIFSFLVKPLEQLSSNHYLGIERSAGEKDLADSNRGTVLQTREQS